MNFLIFRSGVPFAYVAFFGVLLAVIVVGSTMMLARWRANPRPKIWPLAVTVVGALAVLTINIYVEQSLELNPTFDDAALIGIWQDGSETLTLEQNGEFRCDGERLCAPFGRTGRWSRRGDFELKFQSVEGRAIVRRVVHSHGRYFLTDLPDDPDLWDGDLTFQIRAGAS